MYYVYVCGWSAFGLSIVVSLCLAEERMNTQQIERGVEKKDSTKWTATIINWEIGIFASFRLFRSD